MGRTYCYLHAIALQVKHRLQHDVPTVLPLLHGISSVLESSSGLSLSNANNLEELNEEAVLRLSEQLQRVKIHQRKSSIMVVLKQRPNLTSTLVTTPPMHRQKKSPSTIYWDEAEVQEIIWYFVDRQYIQSSLLWINQLRYTSLIDDYVWHWVTITC